MNIYRIYDTKSEIYSRTFILEHNDKTAIRLFLQACADTGNQIGSAPEDFVLCKIGLDDDASGIPMLDQAPSTILTGREALVMLQGVATADPTPLPPMAEIKASA